MSAVAVCRNPEPVSLGWPGKDVLNDKAVWAAAEKVRITENEDYERQYPARSLARVTITLRNGKSFTQEDDRSARSRYLNPTDDDIEHKFRLIATSVLGAAKTDKVVALVRKLETLPDIGELIQALNHSETHDESEYECRELRGD
jgi:2-methylcitrate dehydratase PrpD